MTSLPPLPQTRSSPSPAKTMSRPPRPMITSAPEVPSIRSSPLSPRIVAVSPKQVGARLICSVPSIPTLGQSTSSSEHSVLAKVSKLTIPELNVENSFAITTTAQDTRSPPEHENGVEPPPVNVTPPGGWTSTTPTDPDSADPTHVRVPLTCTLVGESRNAVGAVVTSSEWVARAAEGTIRTSIVATSRIGKRRIVGLCRGEPSLALVEVPPLGVPKMNIACTRGGDLRQIRKAHSS